ncbi:MAG: hypothetical protein JNJ94_04075 [Chlorobi bacterium]|nr:hypothetical protein [Chlorobiota bacterium]
MNTHCLATSIFAFFFLSVVFLPQVSIAQRWEFARVLQAQQTCNLAKIEIGKNNQLLIVGDATGEIPFAGGTLGNDGIDSAYGLLLCTDTVGVDRWGRWFRHVFPHDVAVDAKGNIIVLAILQGTATIDGQQFTSTGKRYDLLLMKFDTAGKLLWGKVGGSNQADDIPHVVVNPDGLIAVVAECYGPATFGSLVSKFRGGRDCVVFGFSQDGTERWVVTIGSTEKDNVLGITMNQAGESYILGKIADSTWVEDSLTISESNHNNYREPFICRITPQGEVDWFKRFNIGYVDNMNLIEENGVLHAVFQFTSTITLDTFSFTSIGTSGLVVVEMERSGAIRKIALSITSPQSCIATNLFRRQGESFIVASFGDRVFTGSDSVVLGNILWINTIIIGGESLAAPRFTTTGGGNGFDYPQDAAMLPSGKIICLGLLQGTKATFGEFNFNFPKPTQRGLLAIFNPETTPTAVPPATTERREPTILQHSSSLLLSVSEQFTTCSLGLFALDGIQLASQKASAASSAQLPLEGLPSGGYLLEIMIDGYRFSKRIVVVR